VNRNIAPMLLIGGLRDQLYAPAAFLLGINARDPVDGRLSGPQNQS
jgi:hypothetical protein